MTAAALTPVCTKCGSATAVGPVTDLVQGEPWLQCRPCLDRIAGSCLSPRPYGYSGRNQTAVSIAALTPNPSACQTYDSRGIVSPCPRVRPRIVSTPP